MPKLLFILAGALDFFVNNRNITFYLGTHPFFEPLNKQAR